MFRLPPKVDPTEEQKRVRADVRNNVIFFVIICTALRLAPFVLQKVNA